MKISTLLATSSLALLGLTTTATAHDDEGWYLRGNLGYGIHTDVDLTGDLDSSFHGNGLQSEGNATGSLGLGYQLGNNWRVEGDLDSLWTDLGSISEIPGTSAKLRTSSLMLNAIYDFDEFGDWAPYVGAGAGIVRAKGDFAAHDFLNPTLSTNPACVGGRTSGQGETCIVSDEDTGLGWQLLAGLGYDISENLKWDTHYTYRDVSNLDFDGDRVNLITNGANAFSTNATGIGSHSLVTGFRYLFGHKHDATPVARPVATQTVTQYKCGTVLLSLILMDVPHKL